MKCPVCEESIDYNLKLYFSSPFGRFKCPHCGAKLALSRMAYEIGLGVVALLPFFYILAFIPSPEKENLLRMWFLCVLIFLPMEYCLYRASKPSKAGDS